MTLCELCGEPLPVGEETFRYHGFSGPCPKTEKGGDPHNIRPRTGSAGDIAQPPSSQAGEALRPCPMCGSPVKRLGDIPMMIMCTGIGPNSPNCGMVFSNPICNVFSHLARLYNTAPPKPASEEQAGEAYRLVPVDPTPEMVEAGRRAMEPEKFVSHARTMWVWEAMLDAAPIITSPPPPSSQAEEALLPCPFCGSAAEFRNFDDTPEHENFGAVYIECTEPTCQATTRLQFGEKVDPKPLIAEMWNRRIAPPKPASEEVERIWHLGSMNDGLFIIDKPPRPGAVDDGPWDNPNGPDLVLHVTDLPQVKAQAIVDAHNAVLLRRLSAESMATQWRPIETAPRDGTSVLLFFPGGFYHVGVWFPKTEVWAITSTEDTTHVFDASRPTHWIPLPPPPEGGAS